MKAAEANFLEFLERSDQLEVPIYQRTYSWTRPECLQAWSDIVGASNVDVEGRFIGSIVEAVATGPGVVLIAEGNTTVHVRPDIVYRSVIDLEPCRLAVAWRRRDRRAAVRELVDVAVDAASQDDIPVLQAG